MQSRARLRAGPRRDTGVRAVAIWLVAGMAEMAAGEIHRTCTSHICAHRGAIAQGPLR